MQRRARFGSDTKIGLAGFWVCEMGMDEVGRDAETSQVRFQYQN